MSTMRSWSTICITGTYSDFTKVSVEKFLRADVNATKVVDHTDAVAIVNQFK